MKRKRSYEPVPKFDTGNSSHKEKIHRILATFDTRPGFGSKLDQLLPPEHSDEVACFLMFITERQNIYQNKLKRQKI